MVVLHGEPWSGCDVAELSLDPCERDLCGEAGPIGAGGGDSHAGLSEDLKRHGVIWNSNSDGPCTRLQLEGHAWLSRSDDAQGAGAESLQGSLSPGAEVRMTERRLHGVHREVNGVVRRTVFALEELANCHVVVAICSEKVTGLGWEDDETAIVEVFVDVRQIAESDGLVWTGHEDAQMLS
jgi:hypothetical protein